MRIYIDVLCRHDAYSEKYLKGFFFDIDKEFLFLPQKTIRDPYKLKLNNLHNTR